MAVKTRKGPKLDPFARPENPRGPMAEFILSLEDEIPYLDAVREYQEEWCDHPASSRKWEVIATNYQPLSGNFTHVVRCCECGKTKYRNGRGRITK